MLPCGMRAHTQLQQYYEDAGRHLANYTVSTEAWAHCITHENPEATVDIHMHATSRRCLNGEFTFGAKTIDGTLLEGMEPSEAEVPVSSAKSA